MKNVVCGLFGVVLCVCGSESPEMPLHGSQDSAGWSEFDAKGGNNDTIVNSTSDLAEIIPSDLSESKATVAGCADTLLLMKADNPASTGPWMVGARTVVVENLRTEIWYPALPGGDDLVRPKVYDVREHLPDGERDKIPDENNPWQVCDCFADLPLDTLRGPYPILLFFHGTAGFRTQSLTQMTHWASRGFVVIAADHPLLELKDVLQFKFGADLVGDAQKIVDSLKLGVDTLAFLSGYVDFDRIGVIGHSAGGMAAGKLAAYPGVQIVIPMAAGGAPDAAPGVETVIMGGTEDQIVPYSQQLEGYAATPKPKRFVGLDKAGHLAFSDLCILGADQGGLLDIAIRFGVNVNPLIAGLAKDGCKDGQLVAAYGLEIVNYTTTAALEARLHCSADAAEYLNSVSVSYDAVVDYQSDM